MYFYLFAVNLDNRVKLVQPCRLLGVCDVAQILNHDDEHPVTLLQLGARFGAQLDHRTALLDGFAHPPGLRFLVILCVHCIAIKVAVPRITERSFAPDRDELFNRVGLVKGSLTKRWDNNSKRFLARLANAIDWVGGLSRTRVHVSTRRDVITDRVALNAIERSVYQGNKLLEVNGVPRGRLETQDAMLRGNRTTASPNVQ